MNKPLFEKSQLNLKDKAILALSIFLQLILGLFFGHSYDMRIFMATGFLVSSGQNPYIAQDLNDLFHNLALRGMTSIGYPPPWALILGIIYRVASSFSNNILVYNLFIKIPIIAANICLAYLSAEILGKLGADARVCQRAWRIVLLSPFLMYFSTAWGQFDSIVALLALSSLLILDEGKITSSALLLSLAISFKPIALPILPAALIYLAGQSPKRALHFLAIAISGIALFCILPFFLFSWNPEIILQHWNAHFSVGGGMSLLTFYELEKNTYQLPGSWWLLGLVWLPALALAIMKTRKGVKDFTDLLMKSTALILVFFLTRAWLSEPNIILIFPLVLILALSGNLKPILFHAIWLLPLVFTLFNGSLPQLFFPSSPVIMGKLMAFEENYRTFRLIARIIVVIPWQIAGWWIVAACFRKDKSTMVNQ
jgi:Gpi18-like mannosyltransferase